MFVHTAEPHSASVFTVRCLGSQTWFVTRSSVTKSVGELFLIGRQMKIHHRGVQWLRTDGSLGTERWFVAWDWLNLTRLGRLSCVSSNVLAVKKMKMKATYTCNPVNATRGYT